ncbi:MAG TPA: Gfo/Idh/MocA family oxidoreductase [Clostridia bacterium]|jgi:predicted dehydrogenase|nr:Gfo/Idh/MocA family oxidoreductase [Clostridiaceae bacterium]HOF26572.1 Gfo/Idh/MocA family oxidoreductase [Clostridia bacterium]HOM34532.1 Gfo/Idh/MocA family oxidoreductase [Clostridia bacterium]HOR90034.1 Gfo/Idh/MocA family oxidoreductase [Clostridia bacterium]HPL07894.1 Gfo/Idh/MocA family oxidoreductase [Clostridia bacterium]
MSEDILNKFKKIHEEKKSTDTGKVLKIGIIGTGWIAEPHVNAYLKCPDAKIVACADLIDGKAAAFCKKMGLEDVRLYRSHKELLDNEELDAVSVCTYNCTHAECAIYALEKGVHVLLEKPMCVTLDEAVAIVRAEKASGKVLSIGFQPRFDENMKMIKKIVQNGELGDVYYIQTGGGRRRGIPTPFGTTFIQKDTGGIGALGDIGCYSLDMVLNAVGYPKPLTVSGYKSDFFGKRPSYYPKHPEYAKVFGVDDFAAAFIRLEGGIVLDFRISWAMNMDTSGDTLILGTKAGLRIPSTECWNGTVGGPMTLYHEISGKQVETVIPVIKTDFNLFDMKIRTFLDAIKEGTPSPIPSSQILYNQAIIDGINKSAELGREIEIKIPKI